MLDFAVSYLQLGTTMLHGCKGVFVDRIAWKPAENLSSLTLKSWTLEHIIQLTVSLTCQWYHVCSFNKIDTYMCARIQRSFSQDRPVAEEVICLPPIEFPSFMFCGLRCCNALFSWCSASILACSRFQHVLHQLINVWDARKSWAVCGLQECGTMWSLWACSVQIFLAGGLPLTTRNILAVVSDPVCTPDKAALRRFFRRTKCIWRFPLADFLCKIRTSRGQMPMWSPNQQSASEHWRRMMLWLEQVGTMAATFCRASSAMTCLLMSGPKKATWRAVAVDTELQSPTSQVTSMLSSQGSICPGSRRGGFNAPSPVGNDWPLV